MGKRTVTAGAPHPFSPAGRKAALEAMTTQPVDVLIIGGGITGVGIARDAALRGWSVALVEKHDFGFGTSSRSSKIVHGGVRYLEYGHFLLVRESARERRVLQAIAPHLVHRLDFLYPVFAPDSLIKIRAGLSVFDWLADTDEPDRYVMLEPDEVRQRLPGLRDPLRGAVQYVEYITDDARLTLENALSASDHGAWVANHAAAESLFFDSHGQVRGARVRDAHDGAVYEVQARAVVNAAGPWAQKVLEDSDLTVEKQLRPSKGIHILLSADRLAIEGASFLKASSGRRGLAMRRLDYVYVGTSDDEYSGPLESPRATREEVLDLLAMLQDCFPDAGLTVDDVLATWAGIRPLIAEEGKSTRDTSREDEVWRGPRGLITIAGGKLTTYRRMAGRVIQELREELGDPPETEDRTDRVLLPGAPEGDVEAFKADRLARLEQAGAPADSLPRLGWLYGVQLDDLIALAEEDPAWLEPLGEGVPAVRGEVRLAVENEMASTLVDFMDRRSALLLFAPDSGLAGATEAAAIMADLLGWSSQRSEEEVEHYRGYVTEHRVPEALPLPVPQSPQG
ncbi:MAG: glycerol-3-phosphate dehydrogenase/oxidase [Gemmatimonadetes bacterium]|nr:glycerol-3-phosphate dehydrogenase/oxidase [Gemmatimonadota bacterium]MDA1102800.1 glycerol-3-phosphate dehydrogenase/oxidase [Gemmatimonadota bacterium]